MPRAETMQGEAVGKAHEKAGDETGEEAAGIDVPSVAEGLRAGQRRALARALTWVENHDPRGERVLRAVLTGPRRAHVIGVTGSPGVGKSTLVDRLTVRFRQRGAQVGVLAVDPSSPFTGGALLGDRIRMAEGTLDRGVFVRSLATRGRVGGLSAAAGDAVRLMDAFGKDTILIETVGAGQAEVEVMALADTVLVVLAPGLGDDIQAIKAGILEIADVLVVNKGDRPGADLTVRELRQMLLLGSGDRPSGGTMEMEEAGTKSHGGNRPWSVPVLKVSAAADDGMEALITAALRHWESLRDRGLLTARRRQEAEHALREALKDDLLRPFLSALGAERWDVEVQGIAEGRQSVQEAAESLLTQRVSTESRNQERRDT